jgi:hypothetical protein
VRPWGVKDLRHVTASHALKKSRQVAAMSGSSPTELPNALATSFCRQAAWDRQGQGEEASEGGEGASNSSATGQS